MCVGVQLVPAGTSVSLLYEHASIVGGRMQLWAQGSGGVTYVGVVGGKYQEVVGP